LCHVRPGEQGIEVGLGLGRVGASGDSRDQLVDDLSNYPKTLSSPGFYGGYTPFSDSYLSRF